MKRLDANSRRAKAVVVNGTVHMGGQVARDLDADFRTQAEQAFEGLDALLAQAGSSRDKVVNVTIWLKSMADYDVFNEVWDGWIDADNPPARACAEAVMADDRILVELLPTAVL